MKQYTEEDMIAFAEMCGINGECGFARNRGKWLLDDVAEATTAEMLVLYEKTRIPPLPTPDDLQSVRFGQSSIDKAREEGYKEGYQKGSEGKNKIYY
jgi:hypothetical protein